MKVLEKIEHNTETEEVWSLRKLCPSCTYLLLIEKEDIKMVGFGGYATYAERRSPIIVCINCEAEISLLDKEVPEKFQTRYGDGFSLATSRVPL